MLCVAGLLARVFAFLMGQFVANFFALKKCLPRIREKSMSESFKIQESAFTVVLLLALVSGVEQLNSSKL